MRHWVACCTALVVAGLLASGCGAAGPGQTTPAATVHAAPSRISESGTGRLVTPSAGSAVGVYPSSPDTMATAGTSPIATSETSGQRFRRQQAQNAALIRELDKAYLRFWRVYEEAAAKGDTSRLREVLSGQALKAFTEYILQNKAEGRGVDGKYRHAVAYTGITASSANAIDRITDSSTYIDLRTGRRLPRARPRSTYVLTFRMEKIGGTWMVVSQQRSSATP